MNPDFSLLPDGFSTPPYLTAMPDVFYHRLTPSDQFLVIASDGVWEFLTPDQVVRLVSDHMQGRHTFGKFVRETNSQVELVSYVIYAVQFGLACCCCLFDQSSHHEETVYIIAMFPAFNGDFHLHRASFRVHDICT